MTKNQPMQDALAGSAQPVPQPLASVGPDDFTFATEAEEDAYWAGVADGIRHAGGTPPPRLAARAASARLLEPDTGDSSPFDFDPVPVREQRNGWTPQRQREFVEALADTGIVRAAASRVGMTEQSVNWLRRRADARAFDRACDAAMRIGARRILSIAHERAIEGTVRRHYFHGELKAEERVYDNRLLIALLARLPDLREPAPEVEAVEHSWEPWMDALERGLSEPAPEADPAPGEAEPAAASASPAEVWEDEGAWLTNCPPPPGFDLFQEGEPGHPHYQRLLTPEEEAYWEETGRAEALEDSCFGSTTYVLDRPTFFPMGYEKAEKLTAAAEPEDEASVAASSSGERGQGRPTGPPGAESDRRHGFAGTTQADGEEPPS
jgi:hypothetical protein